ncbi:TonB-dependent receptor [Brevundimonas sp. NPDC092305]|uniref:TonB-dependent receptor n=1 Tax=Brevundimonas sp. NPDC092305 TaxID=3363957 RepID=UPI0038231822
MRTTHGFRKSRSVGVSALALSVALIAGVAQAQEATPVQEDTTQVDDVIVTGFRASLQNALNIKRNESGVVDAISAEDIADFPDLNLAESLQRIPGVAITRRSGEGRQISVRGLGSDYTRVRVNGMEAIATSSGTSNSGGTNRGRGFDFNIFSSDLFSNLIVRKTASADVDEGSLGATVDLNASKPFDSSGRRLVLSAQGSYNDLAGDVTPGFSLLASDRFMDDKLGLLFSASYDERHLIEEGANITRWVYGGANGGWNPASTVAGVTLAQLNQNLTSPSAWDPAVSETAIYHPRIPAYASYDTSSKRLGLSGALQFRPTDATLITLEALYSNFEGERLESQLQAIGLSRPGVGKPQSIIRSGIVEGNNLVQANIDNVDLRTQSSNNQVNTEFQQFTAVVDHEFSDRARVKFVAGHSESAYSDPIATTVTFERIDSDNFTYDFRPRMMGMNLGFDATDPAAWAAVPGQSEVRLTPEWVDNSFTTYKLNGEYDLDGGVTLKGGVDYRKFEYGSRALQRVNTSDVPAIPGGAGIAALSRIFEFDKGLGLPDSALRVWLAPDLQAYDDTYDIYSGTGIWALQENTGSRADVTEETSGAYVQADFEFDLFGLPWRGDVGVRYFKTDQASSGNVIRGTGREYVTVENSYDMWLPSWNLAVDFREDLIGRVSVAKTIARPGLGSLSPGGNVTVQGANRNYSSGNPFLDPTQSKNVDVSLEWYPQSGAVLALGLFYKDIDTFVQSLQRSAVYNTLGLPDSLLDGTVATPDMVFQVTQPINSPGGELKGFEVNYQQPFTFLPGFWSDFGLLANYTYVSSDIEYLTSTNGTGPVIDASLIGLSKTAWNVTVYYENDTFSARVSAAYRDPYLTAVPGADFNSWQGTNATTNIDAQMSYNLTENVRLSVEGLNLTDEYADLYVDRDNRLNAYTHTGRQFVVGLRYTF